MHRVAVLAYEGVVAVELAIAVQVFEAANRHTGEPGYEVGVAGAAGRVRGAEMAGAA